MMRGMGNMQGMMKQVQNAKEMAEAQELLNKQSLQVKPPMNWSKRFYRRSSHERYPNQ